MRIKGHLQNNFGVIIFITAGILLIPQFYYLSNIKEFSYDILLLLFPIGLSIIVYLLTLLLPIIGNRSQLFLAGIGVSILLCDQFLRLQIAHLDGSARDIVIDPFLATVNGLVYFGLPIIFLLYGNKFKKIIIDLAFVFVVLAISVTIYSFYLTLFDQFKDESQLENAKNEVESIVEDEKELPNIYFIWLDAMETKYMKKYISNIDAQKKFSGFTLFENNSANYLYTTQSYPSFMSGTIYKGGDYEEWMKKGDNLREKLSSHGYNISTYAKNAFISDLDNISYSSDDIHRKWTNQSHPFISDFIAYWLVRSMPAFLGSYSVYIGKRLGKFISYQFNTNSDYFQVTSISDGIEPLTGVFTLKQFFIDEKDRGANNEFIVMQAVIPHGPYVIDRNCDYRGLKKNITPQEAYYDQVVCSGDLLSKFLSKLKTLDRYNSSLIIVMGDHGSGWAGLIDGYKDGKKPLNAEYTPWSKSMVLSRASALLMIKPPKTKPSAQFLVSQKESQLIDIYPTILSLISKNESPKKDVDGLNLFDSKRHDREKYITYFKPAKIINPFDAEIYDLEYSPNSGLTDIKYRSLFKDKKDLPEVVCGEIVKFSTIGSGKLLTKGLSGFESAGRWSDGDVVQINYKLPKTSCKDSKITLVLSGFITKHNQTQTSDVLLNGEKIGEIIIKAGEKNPRDITLEIPQNLVKVENANMLEFQIKNPVSPKSIGFNNDTRLLGFRFHTIMFH